MYGLEMRRNAHFFYDFWIFVEANLATLGLVVYQVESCIVTCTCMTCTKDTLLVYIVSSAWHCPLVLNKIVMCATFSQTRPRLRHFQPCVSDITKLIIIIMVVRPSNYS